MYKSCLDSSWGIFTCLCPTMMTSYMGRWAPRAGAAVLLLIACLGGAAAQVGSARSPC